MPTNTQPNPSTNRRPGPRWRRWLLLGLINLVFIMLTLEIGLRVALHDAFPPRFFEPHAQFGHFHVPGRSGHQRTNEYDSYVAINMQGLRDRDHAYDKPDGVFRILIVGDSFVEGLQVKADETFAHRLETQLNQPGRTPVEVINGGVSRYSTGNTLLFLQGEGLKYQPDLVIYAFYPNDVTENSKSSLFRLENGELVQQPVEISFTKRVRSTLYDISYIYRAVLGISLRLEQRTDSTLIDTGWGRVLPVYRAALHEREQDAWSLTGALLAQMQTKTAAAHAILVVVYLPESFQSIDRLWAQVEDSDESLLRDAPNTQLVQIIPAGAYYLDLLPGFRAVAQDTALYYLADGHFNPAGHALAADLIQAFLIEQALIPLP
ncbi:MAG: SGNH/GDSL hydrolase family protein [Anaerolineae bacterium]|nr:SGNH/GDSL hydrolase family protein [Anaerolineae bacterium]